MKTYTITVNGTAYEVTVEEGVSTGAVPVVKSAAPVAAPKPAVSAPAASGAVGAVKVNAPMPGKILAIKANAHARANDASFAPLLARTRAER